MTAARVVGIVGVLGLLLLPALAVPADEPLPLAEPVTFRGSPLARELLNIIADDVKTGLNNQMAMRLRGTVLVLAHHVGAHPESNPLPVRVAVQRAALGLAALTEENDPKKLAPALRRLQQGGLVIPALQPLPPRELRGKIELEDLHALFKLRMRGGLGFDDRQPRSGIEMRFMQLARKPLTADQLAGDSTALLRMTERTEAIMDATFLFTPEKKQGEKDPKAWERHCRECLKGCRELRGAIEARNPAAVRAAVNRLNNGCNECHSVFRD
jgi:hypothetical protein